jgi:hypothetical protein
MTSDETKPVCVFTLTGRDERRGALTSLLSLACEQTTPEVSEAACKHRTERYLVHLFQLGCGVVLSHMLRGDSQHDEQW